jgi:predicted nucleic acid-binding protein
MRVVSDTSPISNLAIIGRFFISAEIERLILKEAGE